MSQVGRPGWWLGCEARSSERQRTPALVVNALRVVVADGVPGGGDVGHRQHLGAAQGAPERDPESARVHEVVHARLQVAEPPGLGHRVVPEGRRGIRLDVALDLLAGDGVAFEAVELNRLRARDGGGGHGAGVRAQDVDVRVVEEVARVGKEEELAAHVVGVVDHDGVFLDEGAVRARPRQAELPRRQVALLLREHGLEIDRAQLAGGAQTEVAGGDALREEARLGEPEGHVSDLDPLDNLVRQPLIEDVDVVGGRELARLVVVDVHHDPVRDGAAHLDAELKLGHEAGQEAGLASQLDAGVAGPKAGPVASELSPAPNAHVQIGELEQAGSGQHGGFRLGRELGEEGHRARLPGFLARGRARDAGRQRRSRPQGRAGERSRRSEHIGPEPRRAGAGRGPEGDREEEGHARQPERDAYRRGGRDGGERWGRGEQPPPAYRVGRGHNLGGRRRRGGRGRGSRGNQRTKEKRRAGPPPPSPGTTGTRPVYGAS